MQNISNNKNQIKASLITNKNYFNNKIFDYSNRDSSSRKFLYIPKWKKYALNMYGLEGIMK